MRVIVAVDGSECSSLAVESVAERQWPEGTELLVINVSEPICYEYAFPGAYMPSITTVQEEYNAYCRELVESKVHQLKESIATSQITGKVLEGRVADTIIDEAKDWDADLLILGSHGRKGMHKFLLGSVAEKIATHAPCSVEIVKQKQSAIKKDKHKEEVVTVAN